MSLSLAALSDEALLERLRELLVRDALEFHHLEPFARAKRHRPDEITLRCRAHNRHAAIQDFGSEWMSRFRTSRSSTATGPGASSEK